MQSKTPGILPRILFEMFEVEFQMLQVQHEISFHRLSELDDEMFILDNHILFAKSISSANVTTTILSTLEHIKKGSTA